MSSYFHLSGAGQQAYVGQPAMLNWWAALGWLAMLVQWALLVLLVLLVLLAGLTWQAPYRFPAGFFRPPNLLNFKIHTQGHPGCLFKVTFFKVDHPAHHWYGTSSGPLFKLIGTWTFSSRGAPTSLQSNTGSMWYLSI